MGWGGGGGGGIGGMGGEATNVDYNRAMAHSACSSADWGCLDIFSVAYHFISLFLSPSLDIDRNTVSKGC